MKKILLLLLFAIISCSKTPSSPIGKTYQSEMSGITTLLSFHPDGHFYGQMINSYFGKYELSETNIHMTLQGTSMKARTPKQIETEEEFFQNLKKIKFIQLIDKNLILKGESLEYHFNQLNSDEMNIH